MARTESQPARIGAPMPAFELPDPTGELHSSADLTGQNGTLVMFICNHCPYVRHVAPGLAEIAATLLASGVRTVAINPNDATENPEDGPEGMTAAITENHYKFPYLIDTTQNIARAFGAVCTPDFFLYDHDGNLYYRGQLDESRPGNWLLVTGDHLLAAAAAMLDRQPPPAQQVPSLGCSIKWHASKDTP
ncbi:thioredoxin family protein (plasmid) [Nocardia sp. NBC_01377]|uniref:thioredoxin family protein n=1 Tax=Nocardia sp. NBC_01377 TaxID=2903595 RepID=UPI002F91B649